MKTLPGLDPRAPAPWPARCRASRARRRGRTRCRWRAAPRRPRRCARMTAATGPNVSSRNAGMSVRDAVEHGRRVEVALADRTACRRRRRCAPRATDCSTWAMSVVAQVAAGQRADVRRRAACGSPTRSASTAAANFVGELVGDRLLDDEALGGDAALAVVLVARAHGRRRRGVEVGVGEDDERVRAAQLEHLLLELAPGQAGDAVADLARAGQRDGVDARIGDQPLDVRRPGPAACGTALRAGRPGRGSPRSPARSPARSTRA